MKSEVRWGWGSDIMTVRVRSWIYSRGISLWKDSRLNLLGRTSENEVKRNKWSIVYNNTLTNNKQIYNNLKEYFYFRLVSKKKRKLQWSHWVVTDVVWSTSFYKQLVLTGFDRSRRDLFFHYFCHRLISQPTQRHRNK